MFESLEPLLKNIFFQFFEPNLLKLLILCLDDRTIIRVELSGVHFWNSDRYGDIGLAPDQGTRLLRKM